MRRSVAVVAATLLLAVGGVGACSAAGSSAAPPVTSVNPLGDPSDTASPADTFRPTPTDEAPTPSATSTAVSPGMSPGMSPASPTGADPGVSAFGGCLNGNWTAPVSREFSALGLGSRSKGVVRGGSGVLRLTLGLDRTYTMTYDEVRLDLAIGTATVTGPVSGTWSLRGSTLDTVLLKRATEVKVNVGPLSVGAPGAVSDAIEGLPPDEVFVSCGDNRMTMQLPSESGGGTITFDRA